MHLLSQILLPLLSLLAVVVVASTSASTPAAPSTADILYWPLPSAQPSLLARVSYDPTTLKSDVLSYSQSLSGSEGKSKSKSTEDVVRVGLYTSSPNDPKHWIGSLTSLSALGGAKGQVPTIRLHVGEAGEVYHVSVKTVAVEDSAAGADAAAESPVVEVVTATAGPRPHLNRPVVVSPDGKGSEEVVEKTFFQK